MILGAGGCSIVGKTSLAMVPGVMAPQYVGIKRCPFDVPRRRLACVYRKRGRPCESRPVACPRRCSLRMIAISRGLGARRRTLKTSRSASLSACDAREIVRRLRVCDHQRAAHARGLELTGQQTPAGSSRSCIRPRRSGTRRAGGCRVGTETAGRPVRSVDVIVGATYFSMCSTIRLVPSKWLT